jgi:hypothetical protein
MRRMNKKQMILEIRDLLWDYYFDNPPIHEIDTDDMEVKNQELDKYIGDLEDEEVLEKVREVLETE